MGKKKGHKGQKKLQGPKAKAAQKAKKNKITKAKDKMKARKSQTKAVKTNVKKLTFDNTKKIEVLNADITKVLMAPAKEKKASTSSIPQRKPLPDTDQEMPDVGSIENKLASM